MRTAETLMMIAGLYVAGFMGCTNGKELVNGKDETKVVEETVTEVESEGSADAEFIFGKVTTSYESDGCPYLIHLKTPLGEDIKFLIPIGLDEEFLSDGMMLKFEYVFSRANQGNCYIGTPAVLSNVRSL